MSHPVGFALVLDPKRLLILDRDTRFSPMLATLKDAGIRVLRCPYRAPNANAYAERIVPPSSPNALTG